jgi:hypothetical protein
MGKNYLESNTILNDKPMNLITIKESHMESDLLVLKSRLESEGIKCYLKNEYTTQIMSHMANFIVELQVSSSDMERVQEILKEIENK